MSRITLSMTLALLTFLGPACGFPNIQEGYEDLVCDPTGCFHCAAGTCREYRCDQSHQCPIGRSCGADNRCMPAEPTTGNTLTDSPSTSSGVEDGACLSHFDCPAGQICLADGACVTSPGASEAPETDSSNPEETNAMEGLQETLSENDDSVEPSLALPEQPLDQCVLNADCGQDGRCLDGKCYFPCGPAESCAPGHSCQEGFCAPAMEQEVECTFHGECGPAHLCIDGLCYETCLESLECAAHMKCEVGMCVADTAPEIQCAGPNTCGPSEGCVDGKCLLACEDNTDCEHQASCQFGYCHQLVDCQLNLDCDEAEACLDGQCD